MFQKAVIFSLGCLVFSCLMNIISIYQIQKTLDSIESQILHLEERVCDVTEGCGFELGPQND